MSQVKTQDTVAKVLLIVGGRSGEHEVSLVSGRGVYAQLDRKRFQVDVVLLSRQGNWTRYQSLSLREYEHHILGTQSKTSLDEKPTGQGFRSQNFGSDFVSLFREYDVVFPVLHGTYGEDGTIQGVLEYLQKPYVGCGVMMSAAGMDKDICKRLVERAGVACGRWIRCQTQTWQQSAEAFIARVQNEIGFPCFVKPVNSGSSVGINKCRDRSELKNNLDLAFEYDTAVMVEQALRVREIELSVLQNLDSWENPLVSVPGEILTGGEFYSYEAKYQNPMKTRVPADLSPEQVREAQRMAKDIFLALGGEGIARIDLFWDMPAQMFVFNEVNTMPGFTPISMYPQMWEASGLSYSDLLTRMIDLAFLRQKQRSALRLDF